MTSTVDLSPYLLTALRNVRKYSADEPRLPAGGPGGGQWTNGGGAGSGGSSGKIPVQANGGIDHTHPDFTKVYDARMAAVTKALNDHGDTKTRNWDKAMQDYTPERLAAHSAILDKFFDDNANVPNDRKAVFMAGYPGAGKSTLLNNSDFQSQVGISDGSHMTINPDDFKQLIINGTYPDGSPLVSDSEYPGIARNEMAGLVHEESSDLAKQAYDRAIAQGKNIIYDGTMQGVDSSIERMVKSGVEGYTNSVGLVRTDANTSQNRAAKRYYGDGNFSGRLIPLTNIDPNKDPYTTYQKAINLPPKFISYAVQVSSGSSEPPQVDVQNGRRRAA